MQIYDWTSVIDSNLTIFKMVGLWPRDDHDTHKTRRILTCIAVTGFFAVICTFSTGMAIAMNFDNLHLVVETLPLALSEFLTVAKVICFALNMDTLVELVRMLRRDDFQPTDKEQIKLFAPSVKLWKILFYILYFNICTAVMSLALGPILTHATKNHRLPIRGWYPFNIAVSPWYQIVYVHQVCNIVFMSVLNTNLVAFAVSFSMYAAAQFDILIDDMKKTHGPEHLVKSVKKHRNIISFIKGFNRALDWIILMLFFATTVSIGLSTFLLSVTKVFSQRWFSFIFYVNAVMVKIFFYCWFSNELQLKSGSFFQAAYSVEWLESMSGRPHDLVIFMLNSQDPIKITALGMFDLSLETFLKILKTAYSYFALATQLNSD